jgi:hypothetical protein
VPITGGAAAPALAVGIGITAPLPAVPPPAVTGWVGIVGLFTVFGFVGAVEAPGVSPVPCGTCAPGVPTATAGGVPFELSLAQPATTLHTKPTPLTKKRS